MRYLVNHVAVGNGSLYGWFSSQQLSTHFWVGKDGTIEQYVPLDQAAYGQGAVSAGSDFPAGYPGNGPDYNRMAISAEREGYPSEEPTAAQWAAIVHLNAWLAQEYALPLDGDHIVGHYRSDHANRSHCPTTPTLNGPQYMARLIAAVAAFTALEASASA